MRFPRVACVAGLIATAASADAVELRVLSAVGMRQVMLDLGPRFERSTGHVLSITFDSTGLLAKRISSGEEADVALLNQVAIESLMKEERLIAASAAPIARSVAAVAVRRGAEKPDISSPEAFGRMLLSAKSIARPSPSVGGSSGDHIARVLEQLGIAKEVDAKSVIVVTGHPDQVADSPGEAVGKGQAEIALHQLQELLAVPGIEIVGPFPGELQGSFVFSAALGAGSRKTDAGRALVAFLRTPEAMRVIRATGMEIVER
jgi:molybdate transport system substrate-binding protein